MTNKLYIYTHSTDLNDGYYEVPNIIGIWEDKFELMKSINEYRRSTWYKDVEDRIYWREVIVDPDYDYGICGTEVRPESYITIIDKNRPSWMDYDDLICECSNENNGWETFSEERFFKTFGNEPLWKPSEEELNSVKSRLQKEKDNEKLEKDKVEFVNKYKEFKSKGILDHILKDV